MLIGEIRKQPRAIGTNVTLCQVSLLDSERLATMAEGHLSALDCHYILSIDEIVCRLIHIFLVSVEWSLRWTFRLWSNSRQMTSLTVRPIERCGVSRNAVLKPITSATICKKQQGHILTSQTTTVLGVHLTRTWKSWPRAIWSYRNLKRKSLSSCLYPMMWRVTVKLVSAYPRQGQAHVLHCGFT